ncbi:MAG: hypothetical protein KME21_02285 [Desmonostoc vinosum HA7617-LM4]|jgi:hypothetical protein|nr:hypothetical protein [Desmonostoc vinosum HA7617-LM4]
MNINVKRQSLLQFLLIVSIIATSIHYTDNFLFINSYPEPNWITPPSIYISWIVMTTVGIVGYLLYGNRKYWLAYMCLAIYSLTGLSSLGHYLYGSMSQFSLRMHLFICTDGITGLAVLGFTLWSGLILREWHTELNSVDQE